MKIARRGIKKPRIEMLPLIDIVFLLLVFFIYAMLSMAVHRSLPVMLPVSETAAVDSNQPLMLTVMQDGSIFLDQQAVALHGLTALLREQPVMKQEAGVMLFADRNLAFQKLFLVLDRIRMAGIDHIALQAEAEHDR